MLENLYPSEAAAAEATATAVTVVYFEYIWFYRKRSKALCDVYGMYTKKGTTVHGFMENGTERNEQEKHMRSMYNAKRLLCLMIGFYWHKAQHIKKKGKCLVTVVAHQQQNGFNSCHTVCMHYNREFEKAVYRWSHCFKFEI